MGKPMGKLMCKPMGKPPECCTGVSEGFVEGLEGCKQQRAWEGPWGVNLNGAS